jgi:hypothetical protein
LKIVIKPVKPVLYFCYNRTPDIPWCRTVFHEWHEICPVCGGVNTFHNLGNPWGGWNQGTEENWVITHVGSHFTWKVYESDKPADASVLFTDNCIIEYYENGAKTPTKVKEIKVIQ